MIDAMGEFILVKVINDSEVERRTESKLVIKPQTVVQANRKTQLGTVVSIHHSVKDKVHFRENDTIIHATFIGFPVDIDGVDHVFIKTNDVMGVVT